jgi:predicted secreted hydrolase
VTSRAALWVLSACAVLGVLAAGIVTLRGRSEPRPEAPRTRATVSVTEALRADDVAGFALAVLPRDFSFPRDHGPHPEFRTEWWYYTGNLEGAEGRPLGFQLTFFRHALKPGSPARVSDWGATQIYLAHFAVTDVRGGQFFAFARSSRAALGLAGARGEPFRVWLEDWVADADSGTALPMRLRAAEGPIAIDLVLESAKPVVLQGDRGLSRKGVSPGNASYYYSLTRMPVHGTVHLGRETLSVGGLAWMDREWGTSVLSKDLAGWDWFALQLADGREMMFYQFRRKDGAADPFSAAALVDREGGTQPLAPDDVRIEVLATWRSLRSGVTYPARWRLSDHAHDLVLEITPRVAHQELIVGQRYWEGAVDFQGTERGRPVAGHGYVELVGYGEAERTREKIPYPSSP